MLPRCLHAQGATDEALVGLRKGVARQDRYSEEARRGALDYIGDIHLQRGELSEARASYALALKGTFARDARRQIEVKLWSLDQPAPIRHALTKLLAPDPKTPADPSLVLGDWFARGTYRSLAAYLISRRALAQGHFDEAKKYSNQVQVWELPLASLQKEALRGRMLLACDSVMSGEPDRLTAALDEYRLEGLNPAEEFEAGRLQERCRDGLRTEGSSTNLSP
jgi:tetratricopeptide (TPR) repeat protein